MKQQFCKWKVSHKVGLWKTIISRQGKTHRSRIVGLNITSLKVERTGNLVHVSLTVFRV